MWFFPGFGIRPGRKVTWSKVLQVLGPEGVTIKLFSLVLQQPILIGWD